MTQKPNTNSYRVFYADLWGIRKEKKAWLGSHNITNTKWQELDIDGFNKAFRATRWGAERFQDDLSFFVPKGDIGAMQEYGEGWGLHEIFGEYNSGIQTKRDALTIHFIKKNAEQAIEDLCKLPKEELRIKYSIPEDGRDWTIMSAKESLAGNHDFENIAYRPFDMRWTCYTHKPKGFIAYPRFDTMKHFLKKNIGLSFIRNDYGATSYSYALVHSEITDLHLVGGQTYTAPLYLYIEKDKSKLNNCEKLAFMKDETSIITREKEANFSKEFQAFMASRYQKEYTPEEILGYIYAMLYNPVYRTKYLEFLKIDFPRIPFTADEKKFRQLSKLGQELVDAHLMKKVPDTKMGMPIGQTLKVEKVWYSRENKQLHINPGTYFNKVPEAVWDFEIGGYQVLDKFLSARKERDLSLADLTAVTNIIRVLDFTVGQMAKIANIED